VIVANILFYRHNARMVPAWWKFISPVLPRLIVGARAEPPTAGTP
jgi:hypothetical protein